MTQIGDADPMEPVDPDPIAWADLVVTFQEAGGSSGRPLPLVFDVLAVFLAVQAHAVAVISILSSAQAYRSLPLCFAVLALSMAVPLGCVAAARVSGGGLSDRHFVIAAAGLLAVEFGQLLVLPISQIGSPLAFGWGAVGVSVLICAAVRPARDVLRLSAVTAVPALVLLVPHLGSPGVGPFRLLATLSGTTLPALAAAQYLGEYVRALRGRQRILAESASTAFRVTAAELVRQDSQRRLESVRAELIPLLTRVGTGDAAIDDPQVAAQARALGDALRRELVETRSGQWLIDSPLPDAVGPVGADNWPGVTVLDPESFFLRLSDVDRAGISVLLGSLRAHGQWRQVSVALAESADATPAPAGRPVTSSAAVTVVASGSSAGPAAADPAVRSAAATWGAHLDLEDPEVLVADADLVLTDHPARGRPEPVDQ